MFGLTELHPQIQRSMFYTLVVMGIITAWEIYIVYLHYHRLRPGAMALCARLRAAAADFLYPPPDPQELAPHDCAAHASAVPALDRVGRPDYFALHSHRALDLENLQVGVYAAGAARWWNRRQTRAFVQLVGAYFAAAPDDAPLDQDQLQFLFERIDTIFFSGALTQSRTQRLLPPPPPPPADLEQQQPPQQQQQQRPFPPFVRLEVVDYDPCSLWRIWWRQRCALVSYTDVAEADVWVDHNHNHNLNHDDDEVARSNGFRISRPITIRLARRFNGQALTKAEQLEALYHECVHAFTRLYWEYCPREAPDLLGGDGHGQIFHVMLSRMVQTTARWHPDFQALARTRDFGIHALPPGPKRLFVLAVFMLLDDLLDPLGRRAVLAARTAAAALAQFWRDHGLRGVVYIALLMYFIRMWSVRILLWMFWHEYINPLILNMMRQAI